MTFFLGFGSAVGAALVLMLLLVGGPTWRVGRAPGYWRRAIASRRRRTF
jgi:hypothetical protein